jgi:hypothetical protein
MNKGWPAAFYYYHKGTNPFLDVREDFWNGQPPSTKVALPFFQSQGGKK